MQPRALCALTLSIPGVSAVAFTKQRHQLTTVCVCVYVNTKTPMHGNKNEGRVKCTTQKRVFRVYEDVFGHIIGIEFEEYVDYIAL